MNLNKQMKKILLLFSVLALMWGANAQVTKKDWTQRAHDNFSVFKLSSSTTLTITLHAIQAISVNTSDVRLVYNTVDDYTQGVRTGWIDNHLKVFSTGGYVINVGFVSTNNNYMDNTDALFEQVKVEIATGATVPLTKQGTELLGSSIGEFNKYYAVNYIAGKNYNNFTNSTGNRVAEATVTYTIVPK